jgi:hypothetical protein
MAGLRNEVCVICFQRECADSLILKLTEAMFRHLEGFKVTMKPFYAIFSMEDLRSMPHVKLYVIMVDLESRGLYINGCEKDLVFTTIKYTKSLGGMCLHLHFLFLHTFICFKWILISHFGFLLSLRISYKNT